MELKLPRVKLWEQCVTLFYRERDYSRAEIIDLFAFWWTI